MGILVEKGWVIVSPDDVILNFTFKLTRNNSIKRFMSLWDEKRINWRKFKRQGYKCVKAEQTIKIQINEKK